MLTPRKRIAPRKVPLSKVVAQPLSDLVCVHFLCRSCGIIDQDRERSRVGSRCKACDAEGDGAALVFPISIHILVDLMQQSFHSTSPTGPLDAPQGRDVGPVLYFCTLREALMNTFLVNHLRAQNLPQSIIEKLLDDNRLAHQKFGGLFKAVVGAPWGEAVEAASERAGRDFSGVADLMKEAAERRNEFLHSGRAWSFDRDFAARCVDSTGDLTGLFVELHNEYTSPLIWATERAGRDDRSRS